MRYSDDKQGSKFLFIAIIVIFLYLAAFNFDVEAAYRYTVESFSLWFR